MYFAQTFVLFLMVVPIRSSDEYACDSRIYCQGDILEAIQVHNVFKDSKTFVDMPLKNEESDVRANFERLKNEGQLTREKLELFLEENFEKAGQELDPWTPDDWVPSPKLLARIKDAEYRMFATGLNDLWKILGRKMKEDVRINPERYSLLHLPHPFVIPGDRFREPYYWDTYWIIKGLLLSDMHVTTKNIIKNFLNLVERFGHVPNGGRIYYTNRSQPPFLIPMFDLYLKVTNDTDFLRGNMHLLESEYDFWIKHRTRGVSFGGITYQLAQYNVPNENPRPEGYREDLSVASLFPEDQRARVYKDLASAAESGWDFSTRWFEREGPQRYNLSSIKTSRVIPIDLNTFLCINELLLSKFCGILGNKQNESIYFNSALQRWDNINAVFWNEQDGVWYDLDISGSEPKQSRSFFASNIFPLIVPSKGNLALEPSKVERVLNYLKFTGALEYPGGVPTSKVNSGQQWDFPNSWPPLVSMVVESLRSCNSERANNMAFQVVRNWVENNYITWKKYGHMYEKYHVLKKGQAGGGGEYGVQVGFGWSNGVILEFLDLYGDQITLDPQYSSGKFQATINPLIPITIPILLILKTQFAQF